jgi:dCMP deaminase
MSTKRIVPKWDEYFINMAEFAKTRSKDRSTQVGAVIVGDGNCIISTGCNGFPRGMDDDNEAWHERPMKYLVTEHAERNAIYAAARSGISTKGSVMYLSGYGWPCADCARAIIQSGITAVISKKGTFEGKGGLWEESCRMGCEMLTIAGVNLVSLNENFDRV